MEKARIAVDPRIFQVLFQSVFLFYGILFLHWDTEWMHYIIYIGGCMAFNYTAESIKHGTLLPVIGRPGWKRWGFSALITAMGLCLLLKTNFWYTGLLAAFLAIVSKYVFRINRKHLFNPSAFGIIATIILTRDAWLSPAQWGSGTVILFGVLCLGFIVVTRVQKLDVSLAFLIGFAGLLFWRQVIYLGWPADHFIHSVSTGSLLIFTFFMISDPKTSPNHPVARIIWALSIAAISFYLSAFEWKYNTPIWVLIAAAPLVPVLDLLFRAKAFDWKASVFYIPSIFKQKTFFMKHVFKKGAALILLAAMFSHEAAAFCGFYVSKADGTLKNKTSQVILVRDGNRTVVTMYNDFKGNLKDFALVVPVPVALQKKDIKVVNQSVFNTLNEYSKPRLVEYYDQNPCDNYMLKESLSGRAAGVMSEVVVTGYGMKKKNLGVKIEAKYIVGEYDILILSAKESTGLKTWLDENGYKIPKGAEEVLDPYIKNNLKFFVVKVNEEEKKKVPGNFLRPIQIRFSSPRFMLPIRLGMANADGEQDMIVYAFTRKGRIETTNYRTISVPTSKKIPLFVKDNFGSFYANLYQHQWNREGRSIAFLEYAWDVSPKNFVKCDPCVATAPSTQDLVQAGVWWINRDWNEYSDVGEEDNYSQDVYFTRLHIRYNRKSFPQDLIFQVTPNKENFQARYIITHPATGSFDCDAGKKYIRQLRERRANELDMLTYLTGKSYNDWDVVSEDFANSYLPADASYKQVAMKLKTQGKDPGILYATLGILGLISVAGIHIRRKNA